MTFHMDIVKECLSAWIHLKILETLKRQPGTMSQRQLARVMGIPRATVHRALGDLGQTGLIKPRSVGSSTYWELDKRSYLYEALHPLLEGLGTIMHPLHYLKKMTQKTLKLPKGYRCFVFGSTSEGNDTSFSDIDLAIIMPDGLKTPSSSLTKNLDTLQDLCREKFGKRLSPVFMNKRNLDKQDKELPRNILKGLEI